ncbi:hypothetical protein NS220_04400 [Microbacterium testaceum]|uniref:Uncharacterized protein n=1 Tax=Microbacterium testaceum TaxID=2033 RepID=A0A147EZI4_MICTE|nr:hypothetical protein NS220_04400 [Microbacterium testaceum]
MAILLVVLGPVLAVAFVGASAANDEWTRALLNLFVAILAFLAAIAFAVADSIRGLDLRSKDGPTRRSSWFRMIGHGLLWSSGAYLVALTGTILSSTPR